MAPKRGAGSSQGPKAKVARKEVVVDPLDQAVGEVLSAIKRCEAPEEQEKLLLETCPIALRTLAEGRNPFAAQVFVWVQQLLTEYGNAVAAKGVKAKSVVAAVDDRRAEAAKVKEAAQATVGDCETKLSTAEEARQLAQDELKRKTAELKATLKDRSDAAAREAKIQGTIVEIESVRALVMSSDHETAGFKKIVSRIVSQLKASGGEEGLVACAARAMEAKERSAFDWTVINYILKHFDTYHATQNHELTDQQAVIVKIDEALLPHKEAGEKLGCTTEVVSTAQEALHVAEKELEQAKDAEGMVEADFMEAEVICGSCVEARVELDIVMGHFNFLAIRAEMVELPPEDVVQAPTPVQDSAQDVSTDQATVLAEVGPVPPVPISPARTEVVAEQKSSPGATLDNQENLWGNVPLAGSVVPGGIAM
mmetsp:Transcript_54355/g.145079  ORF Transcript_54355/g.145079 Transcript_54355/m.145079 type:complete len:424 (-) Transcript_54355:119-1390(-)